MEAAEGAFGSELEDHDWEREQKILPPSRALAAYDGDKAVGLAAAYAFDLSIPGGELPCAGVTWVGVLPTHRRRGILRDFMRQAARRRAELGRADRRALGLGGFDLRALRLRRRRARASSRSPIRDASRSRTSSRRM